MPIFWIVCGPLDFFLVPLHNITYKTEEDCQNWINKDVVKAEFLIFKQTYRWIRQLTTLDDIRICLTTWYSCQTKLYLMLLSKEKKNWISYFQTNVSPLSVTCWIRQLITLDDIRIIMFNHMIFMSNKVVLSAFKQ